MTMYPQQNRYAGYVKVFRRRQHGVVLFIALIALVAIMLAAVALVRSVDTSSLIAGNISFRRAATSSADGGLNAAIALLSAKQLADKDKNPDTDATYALNVTNAADGYYANVGTLDFSDNNTWVDGKASTEVEDVSGSKIRYVVERMCQATGLPSAERCVFSDAETQTSSMSVQTPVKSSASVMYRVTIRATGPRNTVSYVQAFIY